LRIPFSERASWALVKKRKKANNEQRKKAIIFATSLLCLHTKIIAWEQKKLAGKYLQRAFRAYIPRLVKTFRDFPQAPATKKNTRDLYLDWNTLSLLLVMYDDQWTTLCCCYLIKFVGCSVALHGNTRVQRTTSIKKFISESSVLSLCNVSGDRSYFLYCQYRPLNVWSPIDP
jgi:hypothetical protein